MKTKHIFRDPKEIYEQVASDFDEAQVFDQFDMVNEPPHYKIYNWLKTEVFCEVRDIQRHVTRYLRGMVAADVANAIKYLCRSPFKGNILQDLKKAQFHIGEAITNLEQHPHEQQAINDMKEAA